MHFVELRRWRDLEAPNSANNDPIFAGNVLPNHEVGYPGGPFDIAGAPAAPAPTPPLPPAYPCRQRRARREARRVTRDAFVAAQA